jgi:hypothetical protein
MVKLRALLLVPVALPLIVVGGVAGCGGSPKHAEMASSGSNAPAGPAVDRSKCNDKDKHVVTADTDMDKKPDVWKYFRTVDVGGQKTEVIACKQVDLNHDGKIDSVYYYDDRGVQTELEEFDLDLDGKFDVTVYYANGKKVRQEYDTNYDQRTDLWKFFEDEKLVRIERDTNGDGKVDEWQYFEGGKLDRIGYDSTGSGHVDRWDRAPEGADEGELGGGAAPAAAGPTTPPPATSPPAATTPPPASGAKSAPAKPAAPTTAAPATKKK